MQVVCDPAKIVLSMSPGGCTHKYTTPAQWKAKVRKELPNCLALHAQLLRSQPASSPPASGPDLSATRFNWLPGHLSC
jgi:hypothetical protein